MPVLFKYCSLLILALLLSSCTSLSYYTQSVFGHTQLMLAREPLDKVIANAEEPLKGQLQVAKTIRAFASEELGLPDNKSYSSYVQLKRDPPIWNVVAAEEFSLSGKQWCYLVIGCASYRGYYHRDDAKAYAETLKMQGYDVVLTSAIAYSTLGWFADPLTSAMVKRGESYMAELIFHELSHQQFYLKGDSRFNEAFATAVGEQGAIRWMQQSGRDDLLNDYRQRLIVRGDFIQLINTAKDRLKHLYESEIDNEQKRQQKQAVFDWMREEHQRLIRDKWKNKTWYKNWFSRPINNARLVAIATYRDLVPDFVALFRRCNEDFPRFYRQVALIAETEARDLSVACIK